MPIFRFSIPRRVVTADELDRLIQEKTWEAFGNDYKVERVEGLPKTEIDSRMGRWRFYPRGTTTYAFDIVLLRDGRLRFQLPDYTTWTSDQLGLRLRLMRAIHRLHGASLDLVRELDRPTSWSRVLDEED